MFGLKNKIFKVIVNDNVSLMVNFHRRWYKRIAIVGVPFWYGQRKLGVDNSADILRVKGLIKKLMEMNDKNLVADFGNIGMNSTENDLNNFKLTNSWSMDGYKNPNKFNLWNMYSKSNNFIKNLLMDDFVPIIIGGDHSVAVSSVMATLQATIDKYGNKDQLSLIWIDAHADANTIQNSRSGNLHGMPVSFLVKHSPIIEMLRSDNGSGGGKLAPCLNAKNIVYIGIRDVERQELKLLKELNIAYFTMKDVDIFGINEVIARALDIVNPKNKNRLHVSFDVDSVDPQYIPSTGTPVLGGLTPREMLIIAEQIWNTGQMSALDVVEFNPSIGTEKEIELSAKYIIEIILQFFGKSRIGYFPGTEESSG